MMYFTEMKLIRQWLAMPVFKTISFVCLCPAPRLKRKRSNRRKRQEWCAQRSPVLRFGLYLQNHMKILNFLQFLPRCIPRAPPHTHLHVHSLFLTQTCTYMHSLWALSVCLSHTHRHARIHTHTHTHTLSLSLTHMHTCAHTHTQHTHTHAHTHS